MDAPDFEMPTDAGDTAMNNTYVVTVKVTDDGSPTNLSDTHTFMVTVADVNETPDGHERPGHHRKGSRTRATTDFIATYVATVPDATTGTMTWDLEGNDAGDFTISSTVNGQGQRLFRRLAQL